MANEIYTEMSKVRDPPTMSEFPEIYVLALNKLQSKINTEEGEIRLFEENAQSINQMLSQGTTFKGISNERQFVFKVNTIEGVRGTNPTFLLNIDTNESSEIPFSDFENGEAFILLNNASSNIEVTVLDDNRRPVYAFNIDLGLYGDKRRLIDHSAGRYNNADVALEYEGQIIYNSTDYLRGLQVTNSQKIEESKQNKFDFTRMRDDLLGLFQDQNLRASVIGGSKGTNDLRTSQVNLSGPSPILRTSQLVNPNPSNRQSASLVATSPLAGGAVYQQQPPMIVNTQPKELGAYGTGFAEVKAQVQDYAHNFMPKSNLSWSWWIHILFYINLALLVVSFFVNWDRASFLSMLMAIVYLTWYLLREEYDTLLPAWFLLIGYLTAFALDITWLIMSSRNLWNSDRYVHDGSLAGLDKFMIVMSYVIIFVEFAAAAVCGILQAKGMFTNASDMAQKSMVPINI